MDKKKRILEEFEKNYKFFLLTLFPRAFRRDFGIPWFTRYIYHEILDKNIRRFVTAIPRKHAKTTAITFGAVMYSILMRKRKFIVIISNTMDKAMRFLERIKFYIETDPLVRFYFGDLTTEVIADDYVEVNKTRKWNSRTIRTSTGIAVSALGAMSSMRGLLDVDNRPDMIIGDDIEDKNNTNTLALREKLLDWWYEVVMELGDDDCQHIYIGTIPHHDSLICKLLDNESWSPFLLRAILNDEELESINRRLPKEFRFNPQRPITRKDNIFKDRKYIIWEERYNYEYFYDKYKDAERANRLPSFWQEHFNIPKSEHERIFKTFPTIDLELKEVGYAV